MYCLYKQKYCTLVECVNYVLVNTKTSLLQCFVCIDLYHEMTLSLKHEENNMKINVGDNIDIDCNTDILIQLKAVSPTSKVHWTRNGVAITKLQKLSAVVPQNFTLRKIRILLSFEIYLLNLQTYSDFDIYIRVMTVRNCN